MSGDKAHALLSASSSHRWLSCTPSPRLEETLPEATSVFAEEGTLAHEIAELKLRKYCIEPMGTRTFNSRIKKLSEKPLYREEMLRHTDTYLDYISGILHGFTTPPHVAAEKKNNYSSYAPEGFGTCDCIIIGGNIMYIIDFKYGKGVPVSAKDNPQMKLYALGAYVDYSFLYPIETVKMVIVQPRLDSISEDSIAIATLLEWGESIKPIALKAFNGEGEFVSRESIVNSAELMAYADNRKNLNMALEELNFKEPPIISNEEIGQILERAQNLAKWVKKLEEYALAECIKGNGIPGWKAVNGRSVRQFTDLDEAFNILKTNGFDEAVLYERKPITLTATEELLGKAKFKELLGTHIDMPPGKPTLAVIGDKREAIKQLTAADVFKNEGGNNNE